MDQPDPALTNTLTPGERAEAQGALAAFADVIAEQSRRQPRDTELARLAAIAVDTRAAARAIRRDTISRSLAVQAREALDVITGQPPGGLPPASVRTLRAAAAKLDDAVHGARQECVR